MSNNVLKFTSKKTADGFPNHRWQLSTKVAGVKIIVDASTEAFSSRAKAKQNLLATRKRLNALTDADIEAAYKAK